LALRKQRWTPAAKVRKVLFIEKKKEKTARGHAIVLETGGPLGQVGSWVL
jgi:hypothetical protein